MDRQTHKTTTVTLAHARQDLITWAWVPHGRYWHSSDVKPEGYVAQKKPVHNSDVKPEGYVAQKKPV